MLFDATEQRAMVLFEIVEGVREAAKQGNSFAREVLGDTVEDTGRNLAIALQEIANKAAKERFHQEPYTNGEVIS